MGLKITSVAVSPASVSKYLRPYQRWETNNEVYNGYTWMKAYYLSPIPAEELQLSPQMYQNPFWPRISGMALE